MNKIFFGALPLTLLLTLFQSPHSRAANQPEEAQQEKLIIGLKAQTVVQLTLNEMQLEGLARVPTAAQIAEESSEELSEELKALALQEFAAHPELKKNRQNLIRQAWSWLKSQGTGAYFEARDAARKDGLSTGVVYILGSVSDNLLPIVLFGIGQPVLATAVLVLPTGVMIAVSFVALKHFIERHHTVKLYGGKKAFHYYRNLEKSALKEEQLRSAKDLLIPFGESTDSQHFVVTSDDLLRKVGNTLGLNDRDRMTFQSLKKRALEAGMTKAEFHAMKKSNSDHQLRAGLLLEYLDQHLNAEGKAELEASYPDSFVKIEEQSPHPEVVHWAQGVTEVRDCKALIELAGAVPQGEPALMIMETWNQVILPTITEHFKGLRIGKIHHMVKRSKSLDITSKLRASEVWDQSWQTELDHAVEAACPK